MFQNLNFFKKNQDKPKSSVEIKCRKCLNVINVDQEPKFKHLSCSGLLCIWCLYQNYKSQYSQFARKYPNSAHQLELQQEYQVLMRCCGQKSKGMLKTMKKALQSNCCIHGMDCKELKKKDPKLIFKYDGYLTVGIKCYEQLANKNQQLQTQNDKYVLKQFNSFSTKKCCYCYQKQINFVLGEQWEKSYCCFDCNNMLLNKQIKWQQPDLDKVGSKNAINKAFNTHHRQYQICQKQQPKIQEAKQTPKPALDICCKCQQRCIILPHRKLFLGEFNSKSYCYFCIYQQFKLISGRVQLETIQYYSKLIKFQQIFGKHCMVCGFNLTTTDSKVSVFSIQSKSFDLEACYCTQCNQFLNNEIGTFKNLIKLKDILKERNLLKNTINTIMTISMYRQSIQSKLKILQNQKNKLILRKQNKNKQQMEYQGVYQKQRKFYDQNTKLNTIQIAMQDQAKAHVDGQLGKSKSVIFSFQDDQEDQENNNNQKLHDKNNNKDNQNLQQKYFNCQQQNHWSGASFSNQKKGINTHIQQQGSSLSNNKNDIESSSLDKIDSDKNYKPTINLSSDKNPTIKQEQRSIYAYNDRERQDMISSQQDERIGKTKSGTSPSLQSKDQELNKQVSKQQQFKGRKNSKNSAQQQHFSDIQSLKDQLSLNEQAQFQKYQTQIQQQTSLPVSIPTKSVENNLQHQAEVYNISQEVTQLQNYKNPKTSIEQSCILGQDQLIGLNYGNSVKTLLQSKNISVQQNHQEEIEYPYILSTPQEEIPTLQSVTINLENTIIDYTLDQYEKSPKQAKLSLSLADHSKFLIANKKSHQISIEMIQQLDAFLKSDKYLNSLGQDYQNYNNQKTQSNRLQNDSFTAKQSQCYNCSQLNFFLSFGCLCQQCFTKYLMGQKVKIKSQNDSNQSSPAYQFKQQAQMNKINTRSPSSSKLKHQTK